MNPHLENKSFHRNILWYPPGAGGMWLNYLVFCTRKHRNIGNTHLNFDYTHLKSLDDEYWLVTDFARHIDSAKSANIRLGGDDCLFNFYLNLVIKQPHESHKGIATFLLSSLKNNISYNLCWKSLISDFDNFACDLFKTYFNTMGLQINEFSYKAHQQYVDSCFFPSLEDKDFLNSNIFQNWSAMLIQELNYEPDEIIDVTKQMYYEP